MDWILYYLAGDVVRTKRDLLIEKLWIKWRILASILCMTVAIIGLILSGLNIISVIGMAFACLYVGYAPIASRTSIGLIYIYSNSLERYEQRLNHYLDYLSKQPNWVD